MLTHIAHRCWVSLGGRPHGARWCGWLLILLLMGLGCNQQPSERFQWEPAEFRVKGVYYFQPRAAVNSFWDSLDWEQCHSDFARLREDGFNTIILFVPWGLFQPGVDPVTYSEPMFGRLRRIVGLAASFGLKVGLRVGTHDHIPEGAGGAKWLAATVMTSDREWTAFQDLFREVAVQTKDQPNVLFLFWTFEDTGYMPHQWFHNYPGNVAAFRQWLQRRPLWWWNLLWWEDYESYDAVEPPDQDRPPLHEKKLTTFLEFADDLTSRRLPDPCLAARSENPELVVSFQPRAEVLWEHDYSLQFELPSCYGFVTTWFSPYQSYILGDHTEMLDGKQVASYVPRFVERTERLSRGLPVFVDQFNFQHFGGDRREGALGSEEDQFEFISAGLPPLLKDTLGYALWNYYDYYLNVINNGSFRAGLAHWELPQQDGHPPLVSATENGEAEIRGGGFIRQRISVYADHEYTLDFRAAGSAPGARLQVEAGTAAESDVLSQSLLLGGEPKHFSLKVKTPESGGSLSFTLLTPGGSPAVRISEVMLYPWVDTGGIYDVERRPRTQLRDLFRRLNRLSP